jgi:hypothetical protein
VELIQRKVKTENLLAWEHEKFHLKKINAVTLSSHQESSEIKPSLLDTKENVDIEDLAIKTHVIAEALAASIYNVSGHGPVFSGSLVSYIQTHDTVIEIRCHLKILCTKLIINYVIRI